MDFTFANPLGFLALLGIPAVLIAHILQRRKRRVAVSTLFLIEQLAAQSLSGKRWERLRQSLPMWLQMLAVLLLALILAQPRWMRSESVQSVVVILDSSWSMSAFREDVSQRLRGTLNAIANKTSKTDWVLMESDLKRGQLYAGPDLEGILRAMEDWHPDLPGHDFNPAWRLGGSLLRGQGDLLFVTDHALEAPAGTTVLALGTPTANVGFIGFRTENVVVPAAAPVEEAAAVPALAPGESAPAPPEAQAPPTPPGGNLAWVALVRNYWDQPQTRTWHLESAGTKTEPQEIQLGPGEVRVLRGAFPGELTAAELVLTGDKFTADDRLPFVRPQPKPLRIAMATGMPDEHKEFWAKLLASIPAAELGGTGPAPAAGESAVVEPPDLVFGSYNPLNPNLPDAPGIYVVAEPGAPKEYRRGLVFAETHDLVDDLNWQSFLTQKTFMIPGREEDEALVWLGAQPVISLRTVSQGQPQVLVSADPRYSNISRLPAFAIMTLRYAESVRREKLALEAGNVDANQLLTIATDPEEQAPIYVRSLAEGPAVPEAFREYFAQQRSILRAPGQPSFFEVRQDDTILFRGAAQFADSAEADLSQAATTESWEGLETKPVETRRQEEALTPVWLLALCGVMLLGWHTARNS